MKYSIVQETLKNRETDEVYHMYDTQRSKSTDKLNVLKDSLLMNNKYKMKLKNETSAEYCDRIAKLIEYQGQLMREKYFTKRGPHFW